MKAHQAKKITGLERENRRDTKLVADLYLEKAILTDATEGSF